MSHIIRRRPAGKVLLFLLIITCAAAALSTTASQVWAAPGQDPLRGTVPPPPWDVVHVSLKGDIADLPEGSLIGIWTVVDKAGNEWQVEVTAGTRIVPRFAQPSVGDRVRVIGTLAQSGGPVAARQIVVQRHGQGPPDRRG